VVDATEHRAVCLAKWVSLVESESRDRCPTADGR
jgi:hypothetical protein